MINQIAQTDQSATDQLQSEWGVAPRETLDLRNPVQREERYRQLKRDGIYGRKVGADAIRDHVISEARKQGVDEATICNFESESTIRRRIKKVPFAADEAPYEHGKSELPAHLKSYVHRLEILKASIFNGERLTNRESKEAERVLAEFQDPFGDRVDLIAQYAVLWEICERKATGRELSDIEDLFAFAPWNSNEDSALYRLAKEKGLIKQYAHLRCLAPFLSPGSGNASVPPLFMGAHAHLNLPYVWSWIQELKNGDRYFGVTYRNDPHFRQHNDMRTDAPTLRADCNWRKFITAKLNGAPTKKVRLAIARDEQEQSND